ncbi:MAG TPA: glutamine amidotransferase [Rhodanobacteraceae bacterium]
MKPIAIFLTGHAPDTLRARSGDFDHWFRMALGVPRANVMVVNVDAGAPLPTPDSVAGAIISGSAAMVTEQLDWSEHLAAWLRDAIPTGLPLFGVCYGHQLMAHALGGVVGELPGGREMGTQTITLTDAGRTDPLTTGLPVAFPAHTSHRQSVLSLPPGAQVLARSALDPHHILRYGLRAMSTQLHPEFSTTTMRAYIRLRHVQLLAEDIDVKAMLAGVCATPEAKRLLRRFAVQVDALHRGLFEAAA